MKKIITAILFLAIALASLASCSSEYNVYGLHYTLSDEYEKITVPYSQNCYTDGDAYFFFVQFAPQQIEEELGYDSDITVKEYTIKFLLENDLDLNIYEYDESRDVSVIKYDYPATEDYEIDETFYHIIMKGSTGYLYVITMTCPTEMCDVYEPEFELQIAEMYVD